MATLWQDLRYGTRSLLKRPGFTVVAALTLALGIGANTAIFSVIDAVLLKPLPYQDPDRLLMVWEKPPGYPRNSVSASTFLDWKNQNSTFEQMAARTSNSFNLSGMDQPEKVQGELVTANYFDLFGVKTALGRTFLSDEDNPGREHVVILSNRLWQRRFGSDRNLIGNQVTLDGEKYTVVGILKADSNFDRAGAQIYAPLVLDPAKITRQEHFLTVFARLKHGVTLEQARADMDGVSNGISEHYPDTNRGWGVTIDRLRDRIVNPNLQQALLTLFGAVISVLLIACANLANLTLARAAARQKEMSIRAALGATRFQLMKQLLTESLLLSFIGGVLGIFLGYFLVKILVAMMPPSIIPAEADVAVDHRVLLFTLGVSLLTGLIFGMVPAWQSSRPDLNESLKEGGRGASVAGGRRLFSRLLIVSEVALALVLLIGSGLLLHSLFRLQQVELGFEPENILTMHITLPQTKYKESAQVSEFYNEALRRIGSLPGVESAGLATDLPVVGWSYGIAYEIEGRQPIERSKRPYAHIQVVSPDYFRTFKIPVLKGRAFTERDNMSSLPVIIINETMARRYFQSEDPVGKHLIIDSSPPVKCEIVGIIKDVKVYGLGDRAPDENPEIYASYIQNPRWDTYLAMRVTGYPLRYSGLVQRELQAIDKDQPITDIKSMQQVVSGTLSDERFNTTLLGFFAAIALMLASVGIYGIISYTVAQHTREIGIRMALGAQKTDVLKLIIGQGMFLVVIGVAIGLVAAMALTRLMSSMLFGISAIDPITFLITPLLLALVALFACFLPANRATKVDPMVALRYE